MSNPTRSELRRAERESFLRMYAKHALLWQGTHEDGSDARVYELAGRWYCLTFSGSAGKPSDHYSFRTPDAAQQYGQKFLDGRARHAEMMASLKAKRTTWQTKLQVGSVLVNSWGYDQTNVDYFQVVELSDSGRTCVIRKIAQRSVADGFMSGVCWPAANEFIGEPMRKAIGEGDSVKVHTWGSWARPWTPGTNRWTAYA